MGMNQTNPQPSPHASRYSYCSARPERFSYIAAAITVPANLRPPPYCTMEQSFTFTEVPSLDELQAAITLAPPFAVEIRQGVVGFQGMNFHAYHEFLDCNTIEELHDFLTCSENGVGPAPFSVEIEEIGCDLGDCDHPSLSAAERNPSLR